MSKHSVRKQARQSMVPRTKLVLNKEGGLDAWYRRWGRWNKLWNPAGMSERIRESVHKRVSRQAGG